MKAALSSHDDSGALEIATGRSLIVMIRFRKRLRVLRRHLRNNATRAAVGIEFAFVAPVFFLLLLGIIETGIMFYAQNTLLYATQNAGRLVRTGTAQSTAYATASKCSGTAYPTGAYSSAQQWFKDQICCGISSLLTDCGSNATNGSLHVSVQNYTTGFGTAYTNSTDASGKLLPVTDTYSPGSPCDVVLVRATYSWTVVTPLLTVFLVNMSGGTQHLLSATTAFRNEPYTAGSVC
jgi:Flp pilus assembly protein TadG